MILLKKMFTESSELPPSSKYAVDKSEVYKYI